MRSQARNKVGSKATNPGYRTPSRWLAKRANPTVPNVKYNSLQPLKYEPRKTK
ncbi:MAG: hypothetical protein WCK11_01365 [Candidatus Falkowbacteria bacterium]